MSMIARKPRALAKTQSGFTLIEVLVSTLVLTVGILGVAAMQMVSFQTNQSAYMRSQAIFLGQDILDRIRANRAGFQNSTVYDNVDTTDTGTIPASPACVDNANGCTAIQMGEHDIREWAQNFINVEEVAGYRPRLLNGSAELERENGTNAFTVTVSWDDRDFDTEGNLTRDTISRSVTLTATMF